MVGYLAQLIAMVAHGNAFLTGRSTADFYPSNSVFRFCCQVIFIDLDNRRKSSAVEVAKDPNEWLRLLKTNGFKRLELGEGPRVDSPLPDHISVAFVGGNRWHINSDSARLSYRWFGKWDVVDKDAPDHRIWKVTYGGVGMKEGLPAAHSGDLDDCRRLLDGVLGRTEAFARKHNLSAFESCFRKAQQALTSDDPLSLITERDWLPHAGYGLFAKRLLAATCQAWVFGGMGSWNDLVFEHPAENNEYEDLSRRLYEAINICVIRSANSFIKS